MPFDSSEAAQLNKEIFECIYYASLETSCNLAKEQGPYETYEGSPVSKGVLQHDMWGVKVGACSVSACAASYVSCSLVLEHESTDLLPGS